MSPPSSLQPSPSPKVSPAPAPVVKVAAPAAAAKKAVKVGWVRRVPPAATLLRSGPPPAAPNFRPSLPLPPLPCPAPAGGRLHGRDPEELLPPEAHQGRHDDAHCVRRSRQWDCRGGRQWHRCHGRQRHRLGHLPERCLLHRGLLWRLLLCRHHPCRHDLLQGGPDRQGRRVRAGRPGPGQAAARGPAGLQGALLRLAAPCLAAPPSCSAFLPLPWGALVRPLGACPLMPCAALPPSPLPLPAVHHHPGVRLRPLVVVSGGALPAAGSRRPGKSAARRLQAIPPLHASSHTDPSPPLPSPFTPPPPSPQVQGGARGHRGQADPGVRGSRGVDRRRGESQCWVQGHALQGHASAWQVAGGSKAHAR